MAINKKKASYLVVALKSPYPTEVIVETEKYMA